MHETIIAKQILDLVSKYKNIKEVDIEVGDIAVLTKGELKQILEKMSKFKFNFHEVKAIVKCVCGYNGAPNIVAREHEFVVIECPKCKSKDLKIIDGDKIIVKEVKCA